MSIYTNREFQFQCSVRWCDWQLYHEAVIVNLLETTLYHSDACESADDAIADLIDYLYRKLAHLAARYYCHMDLLYKLITVTVTHI